MKRIVIAAVLLSVITGCGRKNRNVAEASKTETETVAPEKIFPFVETPMYISDEQERVDYLVEHFWDEFDFSDESYINTMALKQAFAFYLDFLDEVSSGKVADRNLKSVLDKSAVNREMLLDFLDMADEMLYDPNSPLRDDEKYIIVLESVINNDKIDDVYKIAPRERLIMAKKNRQGNKANNFNYTTLSGQRGTLYDVRADYTLIFFYNLGCAACKEIRDTLMYIIEARPVIADMMKQGKFKILAVYPDAFADEGEADMVDMPSDWIVAYDPGESVKKQELYDLKAIPTLYLLDKDKRVMLKDFSGFDDMVWIIENQSSYVGRAS